MNDPAHASSVLRCREMAPSEFERYARPLFEILADNMDRIAPTGCSREEDFAVWHGCMKENLREDGRHVIIAEEGGSPAGYFQYTLRGETLMMEEIQIREDRQGTGIFRALYDALLSAVGGRAKTTEAYANKTNAKSVSILGKLGLKIVGENKSGRSWHFKGTFAALEQWHSHP